MGRSYLEDISEMIVFVHCDLVEALSKEDYRSAKKHHLRIKYYLENFCNAKYSKNTTLINKVNNIIKESEYSRAENIDSLITIFKNNFESKIDLAEENYYNSDNFDDKKFYMSQANVLRRDLDKFLSEHLKYVK